MKRIVTLETRDFVNNIENDGCGECQTSCQSACKTSCGVANQKCENLLRAERAMQNAIEVISNR